MSTDGYHVYNNVLKMLAYRGYTVKDRVAESSITQVMNSRLFLQCLGLRDSDPRGPSALRVVVVAIGSEIPKKTADFRKALAELLPSEEISVNAGRAREIMFVTPGELGSSVIKFIGGDMLKEFPGVTVEYYPYYIFKYENPTHTAVPPHELASAEELADLAKFRLNIQGLPPILRSDPAVVWKGFRVGMVVKITRVSETAGIAIAYRRVVAG